MEKKKKLKHCHLLLMMLAHLRFLPLSSHLEMLGCAAEAVVVEERVAGFDRDHLRRALAKRKR